MGREWILTHFVLSTYFQTPFSSIAVIMQLWALMHFCRTFQSPTDSCRNPQNPAEFQRNLAGIQEFCRNDQIPWIPGGFRPESSRNSCYFPNISTFGGTYIFIFISYLYLPNLI